MTPNFNPLQLLTARYRKPDPMRSYRRRLLEALSKVEKTRTPRKERTPYYMVELPDEAYRMLDSLRHKFIEDKGRDYEDLDNQFPNEGWEEFMKDLEIGLKLTNHHPAHIHAIRKTRKIIHDRNFKQVPDAWTQEWKRAIEEYEKWGPELRPPAVSGVSG
jgi:hypothetical protein